MGDNLDRMLERRLRRGQFLKIAGATGASTLLAACGAESGDGGGGEAGGTGTEEEAASRPPITEENGKLHVFEWAGYEIPAYGGLEPYQKEYPKPRFTFLTSDDQALARVRAGFNPDLVHPCVGYVQDWADLGVVDPWDPSLLSNFGELNEAMVTAGQIDGQQYFVPADWGFSAPMYRSDQVEPDGEESWGLFYDERYKGKISWWDSLENLICAGYLHGVDDPWNMDDGELEDMKNFLISKKHVVRNYWSSQTDMDNDFGAGNIWITYAWPGSYVAAKDAGLEVRYSEPKEGRLSWVCGFVLMKDAANYHHAHEYVDTWISADSAEWIINNYAYGHANFAVDIEEVPEDFVEVLQLENPDALEEPNSHMDRHIPNRAAYNRAWDEVKAA